MQFLSESKKYSKQPTLHFNKKEELHCSLILPGQAKCRIQTITREGYLQTKRLLTFAVLILKCLLVTKRSRILKQTCSFQLKV